MEEGSGDFYELNNRYEIFDSNKFDSNNNDHNNVRFEAFI